MSERATSINSLAIAYLPGVGFIKNPAPRHYATAIAFLKSRPEWQGALSFERQRPAAGSALARLEETYRRIRWAQG